MLLYIGDFGETWEEATSAGQSSYRSVASSGDGRVLMAAAIPSYSTPNTFQGVKISHDYGVSWDLIDDTQITGGGFLFPRAVSMSADGNVLVVGGGGENGEGVLYMSTDSGAAWFEQVNAETSAQYWALVCSSDCSTIVASTLGVDDLGDLYLSVDGGNTWTLRK